MADQFKCEDCGRTEYWIRYKDKRPMEYRSMEKLKLCSACIRKCARSRIPYCDKFNCACVRYFIYSIETNINYPSEVYSFD